MKKHNRVLLLMTVAPMLYWQCGGSENKEQAQEEVVVVEEEVVEPSLTLVWETPAELTTCESVLVDPSTGTIYVANIDGDARDHDGEGFISIISKDGEILEREWVTGMDGPKGMGILDGKLYVTDIDDIVEIDIEKGEIINTYVVEGASFLNDIDVHGNKVYFSDMEKGLIHVLEDGEISTLAEGQENINGLRVDEDGVLHGLDGAGLKKYAADGTHEVLNSTVTGGDGLIILGNGNYLASRWAGEIWIIQGDNETKLLDTKNDKSNTADIGYLEEENLVFVPTFMKDKVAAYRLEY
ncbi:ATP-binding protein [Echinicola strongylocentroti]|uniref:ATP-binding protein n=1 Tax=Echinicola strongylocentroti TaxID=1795355 RepID=A0A2Z4IHP1_9BACT|nr:ATP-binding protein [Echinicola strongylocentroti]AWW30484.1 ATP-binding protein [Echinicola strongylocentroti]